MARKQENGVSYYPMNADHPSNSKIKLLINDCGPVGYMIYSFIIAETYKKHGYYFDTNDEETLILFASDVCKQPFSVLNEVIRSAVKRKLFDPDQYRMNGILTSSRIQSNYLEATKRRMNPVKIKREFFVNQEHSEVDKNNDVDIKDQNVDINDENVNTYLENADLGTQSKVNKSKVNKSKVKEQQTTFKPILEIPSLADVIEKMNALDIPNAKKEAVKFFEYNSKRNWKAGTNYIDLDESLNAWKNQMNKQKEKNAEGITKAIAAGKNYRKFRQAKS